MDSTAPHEGRDKQETARIEEREVSKEAERHQVHNSSLLSLLSKLPSPWGDFSSWLRAAARLFNTEKWIQAQQSLRH